MALSTNIRATVSAKQSSTLDLGSSEANITKNIAISLASGTGVGQADRLFQDTGTIAASGTADLDLAGGVTDSFAATITFVKVRGIFIAAAAANTNNVVVGNAASNGFVGPFGAATHTLAIRPGGFYLIAVGDADTGGYTVTPATGDILRLANSGAGTAVGYDILIWGTSA